MTRRWPRRLAVAYIAALVVSNGLRIIAPMDTGPAGDQQVVIVPVVHDGQRLDRSVALAYRTYGPDDGVPMLMLHGTPVAGRAMEPLARALGATRRVLVPDLPGFSGSSARLPDYSFAAHGHYLDALLAALDVSTVDVVAYSQGGGAALSLYDAHPRRVRSVTLLSSIGVQELELLGDYHLNQMLYHGQAWLIRAARWLIPHFGYFDDALLSEAYARNLVDSDQRPLRPILLRFQPPMLIVHGATDRLVPLAAAREHHRLVPQSRLEVLDGGHMLLVQRAAALAAPIAAFANEVDAGRALNRSQAQPSRVAESRIPFDWRDAPAFRGLSLIVALGLLALATYVSEDLACIGAGLLAARGLVDWVPATAACLAGIFTGDLLLFLAGKYFGSAALKRAPMKWLVSENQLRRSREWLAHRGPMVIFASRFVPGTRLPTYLVCGMLDMPLGRFAGWFLAAASVWTPLLVGGAYLAGSGTMAYTDTLGAYGGLTALTLLFGLWLLLRLGLSVSTWRGRRLLVSAWRRRTRWEFWPTWLFYPPVVAYVIWLGLKYRSLTLFTAANPAIPAGGLIGESKSAILDGLGGDSPDIARYTVVHQSDPAVRVAGALAFMSANGLDYPIVLKPDVGERGRDVCIARDLATLRQYLVAGDSPVIVQEFAPGHEFGVFYYRIPNQPTGRIFAVTDKRPPWVTGDGQRTLETLILADDRAVCMASIFLDRYADRLYEVPAPGQKVPLVDVGTHCLGCLFVDGAWVLTPELEAAIDDISRRYQGFYFGRYDLRTPSVDDLRRGKNFRIVELNGVSSEATSIYDPANRLSSAYRTLRAQWRLAFQIGHVNRLRGHPPVSLVELCRILLRARRRLHSGAPAAAAGLDRA